MTHPRDLDEYNDAELSRELARRTLARAQGACDYCGRLASEPPCRMRERHAMAEHDRETP